MGRKKQRKSGGRQFWRWVALGFVAAVLLVPFLVLKQPAPPAGTRVRVPLALGSNDSARLLLDATAFDPQTGQRVFDQQIFDAVLALIREAQTLVYVDFFLWNSWQGSIPEEHRRLSRELADALIRKKKEQPGMTVVALTDPINRIYGAQEEGFYAEMAAAGVVVVFTDLDRLPDSNRLYAKWARFYGAWLDSLPFVRRWLDRPRFANPFIPGGAPITGRQMARLLLFKANHRKVAIADAPDGRWRLVVGSANPADGSSAHSNAGLLIAGDLARRVLAAEWKCVEWSAARPGSVLAGPQPLAAARARVAAVMADDSKRAPLVEKAPYIEWLTEGAIRQRLLTMLDGAGPGDEVRLAIFYLSERDVVRSILSAAEAGARIRLIMDANRDAFGRQKNGVPNRAVAAELVAAARAGSLDLTVRWADTHGEQFHTKAASVCNPASAKNELLLGSANWTRRNINDLNLEADVYTANEPVVCGEFNAWFDRAWSNADGFSHTVEYDRFAESGMALRWKTLMYRVQEATGLCTF